MTLFRDRTLQRLSCWSGFVMVDHNSVWQVSFQRGKLNTDTHREDTEETQGEDGYLKAKERGLEHLIYSQLSEGPSSARLDCGLLASRTMRCLFVISRSAAYRSTWLKSCSWWICLCSAVTDFLFVGQAWWSIPVVLGNWEKGILSFRLSWAT